MTNNRKIRLIQVAKEFKVGLNTITDFLLKKGINSDGSPNSLVSPEVYAVLEKEFGGNRNAGNARDSIRERISQKQASVSIEESKAQKEEKEVIIKSHTIDNREQLQQPKILGKIDLSPKPKSQPQPEVKPEPKPEVKVEVKPEPKPEVKPEPKPEVKPEVKPTEKQ